MDNFQPFPKVPRLSRECVITEKIDGTNASIHIVSDIAAEYEKWPMDKALAGECNKSGVMQSYIFVGSRTRFITPEDDNFGFAKWVLRNTEELLKLGYGSHYGEWWGQGIQRKYGLKEKRFSLFNTSLWFDDTNWRKIYDALPDKKTLAPACCHVVPNIATGMFTTGLCESALEFLDQAGSKAAPDFNNPEGIMIYHIGARQYFKKTFAGDEKGKGS